MNPVPAAYAKLRAEQKQKQEEEQRKRELAEKARREEEDFLFRKIKTALLPYDDTMLDGHHVTLDLVSRRDIDFCVDGATYLRFLVIRKWQSCRCDGPCDCELRTWAEMEIFHLKERVFSPFRNVDIGDAEKCAEFIAALMDHCKAHVAPRQS